MAATVNVVLSTCNTESRWAGAMPVANSIPQATGEVTSSGASQAITLTAVGTGRTSPRAVSDVWCVTVTGGAINLAFNADATTSTQWLVLDGQTRWFGVTADGETINVIDN